MIKVVILIILVIGLLLITLDLGWTYNSCPEQQIIYKFIPRSFSENQDNPVPLDDLFGKMFSDATPWIASFNTNILPKKINDLFISQK